jgi:hypothetical protein
VVWRQCTSRWSSRDHSGQPICAQAVAEQEVVEKATELFSAPHDRLGGAVGKDRTIAHSVERARGERLSPTYVYWKPSSFRCSLQSTGIWSVTRINFLAVSLGGFLPLIMAVMMSGASEGRRKTREM